MRLNDGVPLIVCLIAIIIAAQATLNRLYYDGTRRQVAFAVSTNTVAQLANRSPYDVSRVLATLNAQVGVKGIVVEEDTIATLQEESKLTILSGADILNTLRVGQLYRTFVSSLRSKSKILPQSTYLMIDELSTYKRVINYLKVSYHSKRIVEHSGRIIEIKTHKDTVLSTPIGFDLDRIQQYIGSNFSVILQFQPFQFGSTERLNYLFAQIDSLSEVKGVMLSEDDPYITQEAIQTLIRWLKKSNQRFVLPEFFSNQGVSAIASAVPEQIVRTYINHHDDDVSTAHIRYNRAINERSIQLVVLDPITRSHEVSAINLYDANILLLKQIIDQAYRRGATKWDFSHPSPVPSMSTIKINTILLGVFALLWLVLVRLFHVKQKKQWITLMGALCFSYIGLVLSKNGPLASATVGIICACIGPVIPFIYFFPTKYSTASFKKNMAQFIIFLVKSMAVIAVMCVLTIAVHLDPIHLNGVRPFWGVKISIVVPLILTWAVIVSNQQRFNSFGYRLRRFATMPIISIHLVVGSIIIGAVFYSLKRSGNVAEISMIESTIRNGLESFFIIRPRFKEYLIGYPALWVCFFYRDRMTQGARAICCLVGSIGFLSIINSFAHFHTPVLVSLYRSLIGFFCGMGVIVGLYSVIWTVIKINSLLRTNNDEYV